MLDVIINKFRGLNLINIIGRDQTWKTCLINEEQCKADYKDQDGPEVCYERNLKVYLVNSRIFANLS